MNEHEELWANVYQQRSARVENRNVWFYLITTSIGNIGIVQWEGGDLLVHEKIFRGFRDDYDKAERFFEQTVSKIVQGKM